MTGKPSYKELEQKIRLLEEESLKGKRTEEALRQSEERFRMLSDNSPLGISLIGIDGRYEYLNQAFVNTFGYDLSDISTGNDWFRLAYPDPEYRGQVIAAWREDLRCHPEQEVRPRSYEVMCKDGGRRTILFRPATLHSGKQFTIYEDITERTRAGAALLESENRYRTLVEGSFDGIFIQKGPKIIFANQRLYEMLGYENGELEGMDHWLVFHPDYQNITRQRGEARLRGEDILPQYEVRLLRRDGSSFDGEIRARLITFAHEPGIEVWIRDITERKKSEQALKESEARFRTAFENAAVGMALVNLDGVYLEVNAAMARITGCPQAELVGKPVADFTHPDDLNRRKEFIDDLVTGRIASGEQERRFMHRNGSVVWALIWASVQRDSEGRFLNFISLVVDITERKKAEEEKKQLEAQFQHAQKMEAIGTLAGGLAHDFNNLLMGIQGRASLMLADMDSANPHFEHIRGIEEYVRNAADLTKQLLGFAQGGKYEVKPADLNLLVERSADLFGRTKKEILIHRNFQPDLWAVEVDRRQIEQVLLNLFVNAWQAMPAGGNLFLRTENVVMDDACVRPHGVKSGNYVKLSVTDTGVGMDEQTKHKLFDPFFTTKGMGRGTGLGLASVYGIIKNHDGIITVYSEKGSGSTFNIYLPASAKEISEDKEIPGDLVTGKGTILLVDDEQMILDVGQRLLQRLGYKVLVARNGKEAIGVYQGNRGEIGMIILDMIMPQMNGGETFDRLKAIDSHVKVLLSSGYSINGQAQEILNRGCLGFIQKPFNLRELSQRIGEILAKP